MDDFSETALKYTGISTVLVSLFYMAVTVVKHIFV